MKHFFTLIVMVLALSFSANAQIKYKAGSFRHTNESDVAVAGSEIGSKNMTSSLTKYAPSHDDADIKSGIIRIRFANLANEDIENHTTVSVNPGYVNDNSYVVNSSTGELEYWVHVDPCDDLLMTVTVDGIGSVRIPNLDVKSGNMYLLEVESAEMVPVTFSSNVDGTEIWFDGTPLGGRSSKGMVITKEKTTMGKHHVKAVSNGHVLEFDIQVSKANNHFPVDMQRKFRVTFESNEPDVLLFEGATSLGKMPLALSVAEGLHTYIVKKYGYSNVEYNVNITGDCKKVLDIHKNKTIDFYAVKNNMDFKGASIYINNVYRGESPLQLNLPYGKYNVRMSAYGSDKSAKLTVNDNTSSRFMLKLPAQHKRYDPFNIDFHKREIGFTAAFVQKWMHISDGTSSINTNYFGEEKHMSGFQIGMPIQPVFGYGLGINTGLFFECYFAGYNDEYYGDKTNMTEYCLYMPVDLLFRLPIAENFSIFLNGGIGIDWSLATTLSYEYYDDYNVDYGEEGAPNHFNFSGEFGGGIQYKALQVSGNYQIGLNNNSKMVNDQVTAKLRKFSIQISLLF